jgi:chromosome partitioning protein
VKTIAIANQKGGVGKTTTACNMAAGLAIRGFKTLVLDLDSQCNTTTTFLDPDVISTTLADVLVGHQERPPLVEAIYETHINNLDLAPSHIRLAMLERAVQIEEQYRLKDALESLDGYDFTVIDCPPSLGMTLTQALLASQHVIVPVAAQYYPLEGVIDLKSPLKRRSARIRRSLCSVMSSPTSTRATASAPKHYRRFRRCSAHSSSRR